MVVLSGIVDFRLYNALTALVIQITSPAKRRYNQFHIRQGRLELFCLMKSNNLRGRIIATVVEFVRFSLIENVRKLSTN